MATGNPLIDKLLVALEAFSEENPNELLGDLVSELNSHEGVLKDATDDLIAEVISKIFKGQDDEAREKLIESLSADEKIALIEQVGEVYEQVKKKLDERASFLKSLVTVIGKHALGLLIGLLRR